MPRQLECILNVASNRQRIAISVWKPCSGCCCSLARVTRGCMILPKIQRFPVITKGDRFILQSWSFSGQLAGIHGHQGNGAFRHHLFMGVSNIIDRGLGYNNLFSMIYDF